MTDVIQLIKVGLFNRVAPVCLCLDPQTAPYGAFVQGELEDSYSAALVPYEGAMLAFSALSASA
jgi:hypothetical protein